MDRENLLAAGWSHVLSSDNDLAELEALRIRVGAPPMALQTHDPGRPHLDLRLAPRERALTDPDVRIFDTTRDLIRFWRACRNGGQP